MNQKLIETLSKYNKIVLVGGGTGGHIQPVVSLTRHIKNTDKIPEFLWIGGSDSQEQKMAGEERIIFFQIPTLKLATTRSFRSILYPVYLIAGLLRARNILKRIVSTDSNTAIFSKGGPGSVAIGIAAWSLGVSLYIHESDTIPGRSNRVLGKFATKIFLGFETARQYFDSKKCEVVGQILDPIFSKKEIDAAQHLISWKTKKPHIIVICGSQGSRTIFDSIIDQFSTDRNYEWIIALGKLNTNMAPQFQNMPDCHALDWISQENIAHLIQDSDIAITRGSATTLAELTAFNPIKPHLIIVPLPYSAGNHQYYNALEYEKIGHTLMEQNHLNQLTEIITKNVGYNT